MSEPAPHRRAAPQATMSIGEVLNQLRPEFPEVSISKIRFLEDQGLVEPERAPSGYRRFTPEDVDRLRFVLVVQRDHYLPLRVIREHLEARDRGRASTMLAPGVAAPAPAGPRLVADPDDQVAARSGDIALRRDELLSSAEITEEFLVSLESFGLVAAEAGRFSSEALIIARTARELAAFGIEPRHLRPFRTTAEREAGLVAQVVAPLRQARGATALGQAEEVAREVCALAVRLHTALLKNALNAQL